jgi:hypothetical protein
MTLSRDGEYLITGWGKMCRLTETNPTGKDIVATVAQPSAVAMDPGARQAWVSDLNGMLHLYRYPDFKEVKSMAFGRRAYRLAIDAKANALYFLLDEDTWTEQQTTFDRRPRGGDLFVYDLKLLTGDALK